MGRSLTGFCYRQNRPDLGKVKCLPVKIESDSEKLNDIQTTLGPPFHRFNFTPSPEPLLVWCGCRGVAVSFSLLFLLTLFFYFGTGSLQAEVFQAKNVLWPGLCMACRSFRACPPAPVWDLPGQQGDLL